MRAPSRDRRRRAGFTLVELMLALTISALVIATIYALVGSSAQNFHEQQRVGATQLATRLGLDRLRRDVERAGLHGTPDSALERRCGPPTPAVRAVQLFHNDAASRAALAGIPAIGDNRVETDRLVLTGNFTTSDAYLVRGFDETGDSAYLQMSWQGFRRTFADFNDTSPPISFDAAVFTEVFAPGRMLHITTLAGNHFFVTVTSATMTPGDAIVNFTPALGVGGTCVGGLAEGAMIAPISRVEYRLMASPPDVAMAADDTAVTGIRTGLVREEQNVITGAAISPARTVLEWAIHFDVDGVYDTAALGAPPTPAFFNDALAQNQSTASPSRARALVVEIGARTPEQDPGYPWVAPPLGAPLSAFRVFNDRPGAARVRTGRLEISLPNLVYRGI